MRNCIQKNKSKDKCLEVYEMVNFLKTATEIKKLAITEITERVWEMLFKQFLATWKVNHFEFKFQHWTLTQPTLIHSG